MDHQPPLPGLSAELFAEALRRTQAEFREMPGLKVTEAQVARLLGCWPGPPARGRMLTGIGRLASRVARPKRTLRKALERDDSRTQSGDCGAPCGRPCGAVAIVRPTGPRPPGCVCERQRRRESEQGLDLFEGQDHRGGVAPIEVGEQGHVGGRDGRLRLVRWRDPEPDGWVLSLPAVPEPRNHPCPDAVSGSHETSLTTGKQGRVFSLEQPPCPEAANMCHAHRDQGRRQG